MPLMARQARRYIVRVSPNAWMMRVLGGAPAEDHATPAPASPLLHFLCSTYRAGSSLANVHSPSRPAARRSVAASRSAIRPAPRCGLLNDLLFCVMG